MGIFVTMGATGTTSVAPGWYKDPWGSTALRWWDGNQWTGHLHQPAPPPPQQGQPQPQPTQQASLVPGYYRPAADTYQAQPAYAGPRQANGAAWLSFVAGLVSLGTVILVESLPSGNYIFPVFGLTAILAGVRGILRFRQRRGSTLWPAIVGLVCGGLAEILLFSGFLFGASFSPSFRTAETAPQSQSTTPSLPMVGPTGTESLHDLGTGSMKYAPKNNATLVTASALESKLVTALNADVAAGTLPHRIGTSLSGAVETLDGTQLGVVIPLTYHLGYDTTSPTSYRLDLSGPDKTETVFYDSINKQYSTVCESSDNNCDTTSPLGVASGPAVQVTQVPTIVNTSQDSTTSGGNA